MIALIQRVSEAAVRVEGQVIGEIKSGLLVLLGVEKGDDEEKARRLVEKVTSYRVFGDEDGKMNLNVKQIEGEVLVVSQFTLPADTSTRPDFLKAQLLWMLNASMSTLPIGVKVSWVLNVVNLVLI